MNLRTNLGQISGSVELFSIRDGISTLIGRKKNTCLNQGMLLMQKALAGKATISGVYFLFDNAGPGTYPTPDASVTAAYYQTTGSAGALGFCRGPVVAEPVIESDGTISKAWYTAVSVPEVAVPSGSNELTDGVSLFYGAALGFLDPDDIAADLLMSAVSFTDLTGLADGVIVKTAGANLGIRWCLQAQL